MGTQDADVNDLALSNLLKTTSTRVSELLVRDIVRGTYGPGDRLRIAEIAARYGTSHMPVREAIRQLEGDKIIQITLRRGAIVRPVDRKFVQDMYELRSAIEALLVGKCIEKISPADDIELERHAVACEHAALRGDAEEMLDANRLLHSYIYSVADNTQASRLISEGWPLIIAMRVKFGYGAERSDEVLREHRNLVNALFARDRAKAVQVAAEHCESAMVSMLQRMQGA